LCRPLYQSPYSSGPSRPIGEAIAIAAQRPASCGERIRRKPEDRDSCTALNEARFSP
jgi:hypothetical protein